MPGATANRTFPALLSLLVIAALPSCVSKPPVADAKNKMVVSIKDQKMLLVSNGIPVKTYKISTSKFGIGDRMGSNCTPLGHMQVAEKIGAKAPLGCVFKSRRPTGEVIKPNAPGRDPVVTRILWLKGAERRNQNAHQRAIYIHGTPEERRLGQPASYGCIRMASKDVADLFDRVYYGADVFVIPGSIKANTILPASLASLFNPHRSEDG